MFYRLFKGSGGSDVKKKMEFSIVFYRHSSCAVKIAEMLFDLFERLGGPDGRINIEIEIE